MSGYACKSSSSVWFSDQLCKELESTSSICHNYFDWKQNQFSDLTTIHNKCLMSILNKYLTYIYSGNSVIQTFFLKAYGELLSPVFVKC